MSEAALLQRYWDALVVRDFDVLEGCRHADYVATWPQTGERIVGHASDRQIHAAYPGYPEHDLVEISGHQAEFVTKGGVLPGTPVRPVLVSGGGDLWVGQARLTYTEGDIWYALMIVATLGGLVHRETQWFAPLQPAPEWLAGFAEPSAAADLAGIVETTDSPAGTTRHQRALEACVGSLGTDPDRALDELLHPDVVTVIPQFGVQIVGRASLGEALRAVPEPQPLSLRRAVAVGRVGAVEIRVGDGTERSWWVGIADFADDRVRRLTLCCVPRNDPPAWRSEWVQLMDESER